MSKNNSINLQISNYPGADYINPFETKKSHQRYRWNDMGFGNMFADVYKNVTRYVPEAKIWHIYDGRVWKPDLGGMIVSQQAKDLMDYLLDCRRYISDESKKQLWVDIVSKRMTKKYRDTMLADSATVWPVSILKFDKDPYLFNCQNCTLNLKTFTRHKHKSDDFISKISNVIFDTTARCERWETFISEVMKGDADTIRFLQKSLGYTLPGDTSKECFFIFYGSTTRNGKGVTCETTLYMMGDYGKTAQPETIAQKQNTNGGSGPSEDVARLKGARFVNMSEPDKGLRLNAALVKQLTGGDTVTARFLHQNSFEYRPEYTLFINTNHLPKVTDDSIFASGRVKLIPFERHFAEHEQDKGLKALFKQPDNISGIFNWFIEGLKLMQDEGLEQPDTVTKATDQYREESDAVGLFVRECLIVIGGVKTPMKEVHAEYEKWCEAYGHTRPMNSLNLAKELRRKGITVKKSTGNKTYVFDCGIVADDDISEELLSLTS